LDLQYLQAGYLVLQFSSRNPEKIVEILESAERLKECRLDAVISMPSGVFKPYA